MNPKTLLLVYSIGLLVASNFFMLCAWYLHMQLPVLKKLSLILVIVISWGIAFFEYMLQVPGNRLGHDAGLNFGQLKILQEIITLAVFVPFSLWMLGEPLKWNYLAAAVCMAGAAYFVFSSGFSGVE
ncbi:DMT family protein [Anatilimnocola floriformis]|uniref:DMT family protein n=1 Tax=Anatilimnocola floriformis TaxID=2948575 RepID=UPI0020C45D11|nr:DMT family protein [Anatilimnocola floriformis]